MFTCEIVYTLGLAFIAYFGEYLPSSNKLTFPFAENEQQQQKEQPRRNAAPVPTLEYRESINLHDSLLKNATPYLYLYVAIFHTLNICVIVCITKLTGIFRYVTLNRILCLETMQAWITFFGAFSNSVHLFLFWNLLKDLLEVYTDALAFWYYRQYFLSCWIENSIQNPSFLYRYMTMSFPSSNLFKLALHLVIAVKTGLFILLISVNTLSKIFIDTLAPVNKLLPHYFTAETLMVVENVLINPHVMLLLKYLRWLFFLGGFVVPRILLFVLACREQKQKIPDLDQLPYNFNFRTSSFVLHCLLYNTLAKTVLFILQSNRKCIEGLIQRDDCCGFVSLDLFRCISILTFSLTMLLFWIFMRRRRSPGQYLLGELRKLVSGKPDSL
ncbi:hypothetical protein Ciccas_007250 [Cichlidogyrus casuarinus]|uniref:Taste receptor type 2 n=1 Tax=Cichlidogyrus casuarinus TaxID=1844966 RepID=A0ABD2Q3G1_9PLAT